VGAFHVGTSGWSYPTWRPGFYPPGTDPGRFLAYYAERFDTVELNTTGYRLPSEEQFGRWAAQTPPGFRFAVKMPAQGLRDVATFEERVRRLGDRLGPVRAVIQSARDDGLLTLLLGSIDPDVRYAFDFRHDSWAAEDVDERLAEAGAVRVGAIEGPARFRYLRFREPPYDERALREVAEHVRPLVAAGLDVFAYLRHEDEPTAPRYAERLRELVGTDD
jgi:uncharacterized protein YecE (DUF72 family)